MPPEDEDNPAVKGEHCEYVQVILEYVPWVGRNIYVNITLALKAYVVAISKQLVVYKCLNSCPVTSLLLSRQLDLISE